MEADYQPIPELDTYESDILDRSEYDGMSPGARCVNFLFSPSYLFNQSYKFHKTK